MIVLAALLAISTTLNILMGALLFRGTRMLFAVEDQINDSLDDLDNSYIKINNLLQTPIAFDDPQVKMVLAELKASKETILLVANKMTKNMKSIEDNQKNEK